MQNWKLNCIVTHEININKMNAVYRVPQKFIILLFIQVCNSTQVNAINDSFKEKLQPSWIYYITLILLCPFVWLKCWNSAFPVKSECLGLLPAKQSPNFVGQISHHCILSSSVLKMNPLNVSSLLQNCDWSTWQMKTVQFQAAHN